MEEISRRRFVKNAIVMGAAVTACPTILIRKASAAWTPGTVTHPNVDNLRVVSITDPAMTRAGETAVDWARQEELVVKDVIRENLDRLACALTQTQNPEQAWKTIFVKPPRKPWSEAVVAVKTNHIARQHTRSPVIAGVCHALTGILGVKGHNIHIYDACHGRNMHKSTPFSGLPEGVRIEDRWGGSSESTPIPGPWRKGEEKSGCIRPLVRGEVDILVNISMCKGHSTKFGAFTMTMKNHFGTFSPAPGHQSGSADYLLAINKTAEILGPIHSRSGKVLYPRQQLCLVDALWAGKGGPGGNPSHQPNLLAMGVLSPVVDYQVATQFRWKKMGWKYNTKMARRMLTEFGYDKKDLPDGGRLIEI